MHTSSKRLIVAMLSALGLACVGSAEQEAAVPADSIEARDLTRAGMDSAAQPQLKDVPVATAEPAPATPAPRTKQQQPPPARAPAADSQVPPPAATPTRESTPPAPTTGVIAAGTTLPLNASQKVCTNTNKVGDRFSATLTAAIVGSNGAMLAQGSEVAIELIQLTPSRNKDEQIVMGFRVVSITSNGETYTPDAEVVNAEIDRVRSQSSGDAAKKVAGGAVAGAIVGQILGRDRKGTLIGAAVGAAAGAAAAAASDDFDGCVNAGAAITVRLNGPVTVKAG